MNLTSSPQKGVAINTVVYIVYYTMLLLLTFMLTTPNAMYGMAVRYAYMFAVIVPLFFNKSYAAFVLPLFCGISQTSFVSFMPTTSIYFLIIVGALSVMQMRMKYREVLFLGWILYIMCIEMISPIPHFECVIWGLTALLYSSFVNTKLDIKKMGFAFSLISLVLGILFIIYFDEFSRAYGAGEDDIETSGWINTNIFGGVVGCGMVASVFMLVSSKEMSLSRWHKLLCVIVVVISIIALVLNASRGAIVASALSSAMLLFSSKTQMRYRLLSFLGIVLLIIILYRNGYFELLEMRVLGEETTSTAGGRTEIWAKKLGAFVDLPIYQQIFGIGYDECVNLGIYFDTHNDFVTALCAYGYIGFFSFTTLFIMPIFIAQKGRRVIVAELLLFLALESAVLSPIFRGYFILIIFYVMIIKYAMLTNDEDAI